MSVGFIELIAILLSLGGFGIGANPKAPPAAEIMRYAPADADLMVHLDVQAVLPRNYEALAALPTARTLAMAPDARAMIEDTMREVETARGMVKGLMGIDPITDIHSLTLWLDVPAAGEPDMLVVARGAVSSDMIDRISTMAGAPTGMAHGHKTLTAPGGDIMLAVKDGAVLFGTPAWVEPRLIDGWKPLRQRPGSPGARAAALLDGAAGKGARKPASKPFLAVVSSPSEDAVARASRAVGAGGNVAADIVAGHAVASAALYHDGVSWSVTARSKQGYERVALASEGLVALLRAGHHASRGAARLVLASLASYAGTDEGIAAILRHRDELVALVDGMTGGGDFRVDLDRRPGQRTIAVRARGSKLTDVMPVAGIAPIAGALAYFTVARRELGVMATEPAAEMEAPVREMTPAGSGHLRVDTVYREVKRTRGME